MDRKKILPAVLRLLCGAGSALLKILGLLGFVCVVSFSFLALYQFLLSSPYMRLMEVQIAGVEEGLREEIITAHGLDANRSLLGIHLHDLKREIERHPAIRSVRLERRFPKTLIVEVEKQEPLAVVLTDRMYYMNGYGEIFREVGAKDSVDFPLITGISKERAQSEEPLANVAHVIGVLQGEVEPLSLGQVSEIHVRKDDEMSLYFDSLKAEVRFKWHHLKEKMAGLRKVSRHLAQSGKIDQINRIDLNYRDGAVVSYKNS